jgi:hypothetical protein
MGLGGVPAKAVDDFILRKFAEGAVEEGCPWEGLTSCSGHPSRSSRSSTGS